jgi:ferredoxin
LTTKTLRKIIRIDEEKCDGCGLCIIACAEGALQIIDGKAKLISEIYCDGLGNCLGECPQGAITIEERTAEDFNEEAVKLHLKQQEHTTEEPPCGCPSAAVSQFESQVEMETSSKEIPNQASMLSHWPVQLTLVPPTADFLQETDLVLAADCVPFAYANFHQDFLRNNSLLVACPKLDDFETHQKKLTEILRESSINSLTVVHMEVPCCFGMMHMARQAILASGKDIPLREVTIGVRGNLKF